ncbi:GNAT family N-acetyltransferase [Nocardia salmonicida]|uniref:GNAT family N-acetyltransferase n=1 Tax=Nocardia salmonicida TaxID=53431 RepID=A0ABZ1NH37_9NOCA
MPSHPEPDASGTPTLIPNRLDHPDSSQLMAEYAKERRAMVGFDDPPNLDRPEQYEPHQGLFIVAYAEGEPVACGGLRTSSLTERTAEIRKMFVVPNHRKRGVARLVLCDLEKFAFEHGVARIILETGSYNQAAMRLYASAGYTPIPPYVPGRPDFNRAFAKDSPVSL